MTLITPLNQLTRDEFILFAEFSLAAGHGIRERSKGIALLNKVAEEKGYSQLQAAHVTAFLDELYLHENSEGSA